MTLIAIFSFNFRITLLDSPLKNCYIFSARVVSDVWGQDFHRLESALLAPALCCFLPFDSYSWIQILYSHLLSPFSYAVSSIPNSLCCCLWVQSYLNSTSAPMEGRLSMGPSCVDPESAEPLPGSPEFFVFPPRQQPWFSLPILV